MISSRVVVMFAKSPYEFTTPNGEPAKRARSGGGQPYAEAFHSHENACRHDEDEQGHRNIAVNARPTLKKPPLRAGLDHREDPLRPPLVIHRG